MSYEIVNTLRSKSLVRITGNTATNINLSSLAASSNEHVTNAVIAQVSCSGDGVWRIYRGDNDSGVLVLELAGFANFPFYEYDITLANNSSSNVYVTNSGTAGTLIMQLGKETTYTAPLPIL